ncbi:MAG: hypothetical protein EOP10_07485 [Proteobacteria bacterium]|nr:MAG: hypothetical protein EOP10_07485 [Pseudomonadota bacterium]
MRSVLILALFLLCSCSGPQNSSLKTEHSNAKLSNLDFAILIPYLEWPDLIDRVPSLKGADTPEGSPYLAAGTLLAIDGRLRFPKFDSQIDNLHLSAIRFQPCANLVEVKPSIESCIPEMRIVWQSIERDEPSSKEIVGLDRNIHTSYKLSSEEFRKILSELRALKAASNFDDTNLPLYAHPILIKEGLESPYLAGLLKIVNRYGNAAHLSSVAAQVNASISGRWPMTVVGVRDGQVLNGPLPIFGDQNVFVQELSSFDVTEIDAPDFIAPIKDDIFIFPRDIADLTPDNQTIVRENIVNATHRFENPLLENPNTVDCASCHMARIVRERFIDRFPELEAGAKDIYQNPKWNLIRKDELSTTHASLQLFSFMGEYFVSQRVINESALDVDMAKALYPE